MCASGFPVCGVEEAGVPEGAFEGGKTVPAGEKFPGETGLTGSSGRAILVYAAAEDAAWILEN